MSGWIEEGYTQGISGDGSFGEYGGQEYDFKEEVGGKEGHAGKEEE